MAVDTDSSTQQHTIVVVCIVSPIVSSLFVAMRIWTRAFVTHSIGRDDCKLPRLCSLEGLVLTRYRYCLSHFGENSGTPASNVSWPTTETWNSLFA